MLLTFFLGNIRKVSFFEFGSKLQNFFSITCLNLFLENIHDSANVIVWLAITIPSPLKSLSLLHFGLKNQGAQQKDSKIGWE